MAPPPQAEATVPTTAELLALSTAIKSRNAELAELADREEAELKDLQAQLSGEADPRDQDEVVDRARTHLVETLRLVEARLAKLGALETHEVDRRQMLFEVRRRLAAQVDAMEGDHLHSIPPRLPANWKAARRNNSRGTVWSIP
jgi:hypothetical protein